MGKGLLRLRTGTIGWRRASLFKFRRLLPEGSGLSPVWQQLVPTGASYQCGGHGS